MGHETEAACLLRTGNLYSRRVGVTCGGDELTFAGVKHGAFSIYFGDEPHIHFDLEGRWQRTFRAGVHYRKALDGSIDAIDRVREGANLILRRRTLSFAEASDLDDAVRGEMLALLSELGAGRLHDVPPPAQTRRLELEELRELLERAAQWDAARWFAQRERYLDTYGPLPFLPPDAHQAVVLQATLGHAEEVTFGGGSLAESYVRSVAEFEEHARTVSKLLGRRVAQNRSVFLAGTDVLRQPMEVVTAYFETITRVFPIDRSVASQRRSERADDAVGLRGVDVFLDDFRAGLPGPDGWSRLRSLHLGRMNLGVESGDASIRERYGKTWCHEDLKETVGNLKRAGIELGLILLVGAGGEERAQDHIAATADLVNALELGRGDLVYLVDAAEVGRLPSCWTALSASARNEQQNALKERLEPVRLQRGAKVTHYSVEKQWN